MEMYSKIAGHRELTETFLGSSDAVKAYRARIKQYSKKRKVTLERLKKSLAVKVPRIAMQKSDTDGEGEEGLIVLHMKFEND